MYLLVWTFLVVPAINPSENFLLGCTALFIIALHDLAKNCIGVIYSRWRHINNFTSTSIFITEDGDIHRVGR